MFNVEIFWNFDTGAQKTIFCFLSNFTFSNSCYGFPLMKEFNPFYPPHLVLYDMIGNIFVQSSLIRATFHFFNQKCPLLRMFLQNSFQKWRSSRSQMFFKIGVLINFPIFKRKYLLWNPFFNDLKACNFNKKRDKRFPVNITKFLRTVFLWHTSGGCFWIELKNF